MQMENNERYQSQRKCTRRAKMEYSHWHVFVTRGEWFTSMTSMLQTFMSF